ncbi:F-box/LRR-repeat protein [Citrus sinensis]|uniref:F-box/LRR-repeat protein At3g58900 n=1 Tax=Citrus clementina TaxID=85681 RepID=UPI0003D6FD0F|nr:F-box/LRR-repeat protein At3g58900 [Citrus x clementina]XP_024949512.1 F-box/LRR-repeat protein At3g58900-like isoform X1 [Citrus sinensis]KAH9651559.1 F-box/LRR-repeat protein [Citrus sinensis]
MVGAFKSTKIPRLRCGGEDVDRLSNLPEPIIHHIFSFLGTIDVVRASAVSRKWRCFWLSIPYLNFNIHNIWSNPQEKWSLEKINEKFKDFVNWVLLSQNGSINIQRFLLSCFNCVDDYTLYRWLSAVAQRNVQVLDLDIISEEPIKLPLCLVTCESLVSLKLDFGKKVYHQGVLELPTCAGFTRLKSLDLQKVELLDSNLFRKFISSCPLLENLNMAACFFRDFKILDISTTSLKHLTIDDVGFCEPKGLANCEVKLACPNLLSLKFSGSAELEFSFEGLKSLKKAYIYLDIDGDDDVCYGVSKIFNGVRNAEVLKLNMVVSWLLNVVFAKPDCFFSPLYNLKSLKLIVGPFDQTIQSTINLLNCSPNLEALAIYFDWFKDGDLWKIPDKGIPCLTHHLKTVEILEFYGNENQLELVRFILKCGQVLQKMSITWGYSGVKYPIKISRQVKEFPRLSPTAALEFLEPFYEWFDHFGL